MSTETLLLSFKKAVSLLFNKLLREVKKLTELGEIQGIKESYIKIASDTIGELSPKETMEYFIKKSVESKMDVWKIIINRNPMELSKVVSSMIGFDLSSFDELIDKKKSNGDYLIDRDTIKYIFDSLIILVKKALLYIHKERKPTEKTENGETKIYYRANYYPQVDIPKYQKLYGI